METILNLVDRFRGTVWLVTLALLGASLFLLTKLEILDSPERWMPRPTVEAWGVFDSHFDVGDTVAVGLHFQRPITEEDLPRLSKLRKRFAAIKGVKQVYDTSLVAEEIEAVPLMSLIARENHERFNLYAGALWDTPPVDDPTRTLVTVCELEFHPDKETDDVLNERRRAVVNSVHDIVADEKEHAGWGQQVDFHVASAIVMMMELEKR
ncbi:MAG: hypothetical protein ABUL64_04595, partial [Singulisphaera sp.]